jgi:hypothetical protein
MASVSTSLFQIGGDFYTHEELEGCVAANDVLRSQNAQLANANIKLEERAQLLQEQNASLGQALASLEQNHHNVVGELRAINDEVLARNRRLKQRVTLLKRELQQYKAVVEQIIQFFVLFFRNFGIEMHFAH